MSGFSYNPGITDISGQLRAQGTTGAADAIARGVGSLGNSLVQATDIYTKHQQENKALTSQAKAIETLLPAYASAAGIDKDTIDRALISSPDESPRARVARLSQTLEGIVTTSTLKQKALQDQQLQTVIAGEQQRQDALRQQIQQGLADRGRTRALFGGNPSTDETGAILREGGNFQDTMPGGAPPATGADALRSSLAAGITDPRLLDSIGRYAGPKDENWRPSLVDVGDGFKALMTSAKSAVPAIHPAAEKPTTKEVKVGERTLTVGPGNKYFDAAGQPVDFTEDKPLTVNEFMLAPALSSKFGDDYGQYRAAYSTQLNKLKPKPAATAGVPSLQDIQAEMERRRRANAK